MTADGTGTDGTDAAHGIAFDRVTARIGTNEILHEVTATAPAGRVTAIVGPNGSGKSTLLRTLFRAIRHTGTARAGGDDVATLSALDRVARLAVLTQEQEFSSGTRIREVVALGRTARLGSFGRITAEDRRIIDDSLEQVDIGGLADRDIATLSGGERQRAHVARVLAQRADIVVMDEPTNHLDISHQLAILRLLRELAREHGRTVMVALHDLGLAARWADHVVVVRSARVVAAGAPEGVLTPELIVEHFGVDACWVELRGERRLVVG